MLHVAALLLPLLAAPAYAEDDELDWLATEPAAVAEQDDELEDLVTVKPQPTKAANTTATADDFNLYGDDDFAFPSAQPDAPVGAPGKVVEVGRPEAGLSVRPEGIPVSAAGRMALMDNFDARVVHVEADSVVVELPVLVAQDRSSVGEEAFWVVGTVLAGDQVVAESWQRVAPATVAGDGPSFVFLKLQVPVTNPTGELVVKVARAARPGTTSTELFATTVDYALAGS